MPTSPKSINGWLKGLTQEKMDEMVKQLAIETCQKDIVPVARRGLLRDVFKAVFRREELISPENVSFTGLARTVLQPVTAGPNLNPESVNQLSDLLKKQYDIFAGITEKEENSVEAPPTKELKKESGKMAKSNDELAPKGKIKMDFKGEMAEAGWQIAAQKSTETAKTMIVSAMLRDLPENDEGTRAKIAAVLDTPFGTMLVSLVLSGLVSGGASMLGDKLPEGTEEKLAYLGSKFRINAMATGGKALLDEILDPIIAQGAEMLRALPEEIPGQRERPSLGAKSTVGDEIVDVSTEKAASRVGVKNR